MSELVSRISANQERMLRIRSSLNQWSKEVAASLDEGSFPLREDDNQELVAVLMRGDPGDLDFREEVKEVLADHYEVFSGELVGKEVLLLAYLELVEDRYIKDSEAYLSLSTAAEQTGYSKRQLWGLVQDGEVTGFRVEGVWHCDVRAVRRYSAASGIRGPRNE